MKPPARILENADLLAYAVFPATARFTGRLHLFAGGKRIGRVPHLAICKPDDEPGLFLAHCDESWGIVALEAWNGPGVPPIMSVEAMKHEAERYYEGLMASWKDMPSGDA